MAYKVLAIPGGSTIYDDEPEVRIIALRNQPLTFVFKYVVSGSEACPVFGEITFTDVLEYRWVVDFLEYEDFPEHSDDGSLGLVEILDSRYIENIASKTQFRNHPGKRLGPGINEGQVKHYRIGVDDHGSYDIFCLGVVITEIKGDGPPEPFNSSELMRDPEGSA